MTSGRMVTTEDFEGSRLIGLSRPEVHNALNQDLVRALVAALRERPPDTRCVVLFGHGSSFCAGGDRREGIAGSDGNALETLEGLQEITRQLQSPDLIVIAAVEGWAIGGGAEIALACDLVLAGDDASFRFPEAQLDAHATGGSTWLLPRTVGIHRAKALLFTGMPLPAPLAKDWGLVMEVTPKGGALTRAKELAGEMTRLPEGSVQLLKRSLQSGLHGTLEDTLVNEVRQAHPRLTAGGFLGSAASKKE